MNHTPSQRRAVDSDAKNILCLAGPGGGKSRTLVTRIQRLVASGVNPRNIAAIPFTNAATKVLQERLGDIRLGANSTLHSFALRNLKELGAGMGYGSRIAIVNEEATLDLLASKAQSLGYKGKVEKLVELKAKGRPARMKERRHQSVEELVILGYYDDLRESALVDLDSILTEFLALLTDDIQGAALRGYEYVFIDEAQDASEIDWRIYDALPIANKFFCADPDQAIYSFRGGRVDCLLAYSKRLSVETILLEDNFRSHAEICDAAQRLIEHNVGRIAKRTVSVKGAGGSVTKQITGAANAGHEIAMVAHQIQKHHVGKFSEIAVLTRTNALAHDFREALKAAGIPVVEPPKSDLPKDWPVCRALVDLLVNPENDVLAMFYIMAKGNRTRAEVHEMRRACTASGHSMNRLLAFPSGLGPSGLGVGGIGQQLAESGITAESRMLVAQKIRQLPAGAELLDLALLLGQHDAPEAEAKDEGVTVCTLHAAKGREWDVVFLVGFEDEAIPGQRKSDGPEQVAEERRLAYVGVTRARSHLYISHAAQREMVYGPKYKKIEPRTPSRFIKEMLDS